MRRKFLAILLTTFITIGLVACGSKEANSSDNKPNTTAPNKTLTETSVVSSVQSSDAEESGVRKMSYEDVVKFYNNWQNDDSLMTTASERKLIQFECYIKETNPSRTPPLTIYDGKDNSTAIPVEHVYQNTDFFNLAKIGDKLRLDAYFYTYEFSGKTVIALNYDKLRIIDEDGNELYVDYEGAIHPNVVLHELVRNEHNNYTTTVSEVIKDYAENPARIREFYLENSMFKYGDKFAYYEITGFLCSDDGDIRYIKEDSNSQEMLCLSIGIRHKVTEFDEDCPDGTLVTLVGFVNYHEFITNNKGNHDINNVCFDVYKYYTDGDVEPHIVKDYK